MKTTAAYTRALVSLFFVVVAVATLAGAQTKSVKPPVAFTILQTSDLHSHFTNRDSTLQLGGYDRLITKIQELRAQNPTTLLLDAGDFSEGNIFFSHQKGITSFRLLDVFQYDAIALGNHDWYVGPETLAFLMETAKPKVPILMANLAYSKSEPEQVLKRIIKPYTIKNVAGLRVGILGLSTDESVYKGFFLPVKVTSPIAAARTLVPYLRRVEKCDVIIVLSHLGIEKDKELARKVNGIDLITGGHNHLLLHRPVFENGVPITHVGSWGQYVGELKFVYDGKHAALGAYAVHPVTQKVVANIEMKERIAQIQEELNKDWGKIFDDALFTSDVDLPGQDQHNENLLANLATDAMRAYAQTDIALENPTYVARGLLRGTSNTVDIFNSFPYIANPITGHSWTIKIFRLPGWAIKAIFNFLFQYGILLKVSNCDVVLNYESRLSFLHSIKIGGKPVENFKTYSVAGSEGIFKAVQFLRAGGAFFLDPRYEDTGIEAWRVIAAYLKARSPLTVEKLKWESRIRTLQPDLIIRPEEVLRSQSGHELQISFKVRNAGLEKTAPTHALVQYYDSLAVIRSETAIKETIAVSALQPGEGRPLAFRVSSKILAPGRYSLRLHALPVAGERQTQNNIAESYFDVPAL